VSTFDAGAPTAPSDVIGESATMVSRITSWRRLLVAACAVAASAPSRGEHLAAAIRPAGFEGAHPAVALAMTLPPAALRGRWDAQGAPVVVVVPDHLGLDARAEFHTAALLAAGIAVLRVDVPAAAVRAGPGVGLPPEPRASPADDLLPALFGILRALDAERPPNGRPVGLLGFGAGGQAAVMAAHEAVARALLPGGADGPRFSAHAALYPTCLGPLLRKLRNAGAPTTGAPVLVVLAQEGGPAEDPGGCGVLFELADADEPDPFTVRAYPWTRYGFDLWPALGGDPAPLDAAVAELARRDVAAVLIPALAPDPRP
jgi:dienelactone hydrolase